MKKSHKIIFLLGRPLSPIYSLIMVVRAFLYLKSIFKKTKLAVPVISIGNLTMGGTGKTPMVLYIAKLFSLGNSPAIVSRGYGGKVSDDVNVVSDKEQIFLDAAQAGDEPVLLASSLPGVPVLTGKKRAIVGEYAVGVMKSDLVIMDDGFQHMSLCRDLDLVLFSASVLLSDGWVCPGGILREPYGALKRADAFILTGVNNSNIDQVKFFQAELLSDFPNIPQYTGSYKAKELLRVGSSERLPIDKLKDIPLLAFCGIATPVSFFNTLSEEGLVVGETLSFGDHHVFSDDDLKFIEKSAKEKGCQGLIITEKDFVKIRHLNFELPIWSLIVELEMSEGFDDFLKSKIHNLALL